MLERNDDGGFDVTLFEPQRQMLSNLIAQLRDLLVADSSHLLRRLYPTAHPGDAEANARYDELVHDQLLEHQLAALETVESSLDSSTLSEAQLTQWMTSINSLRLVLGTRLDVSEEDDLFDPYAMPEDDPDFPFWVSYVILTEMLDLIIAALST